MADVAHQEGNILYKKGDLEGAEQSYSLAHKLDPTEPKYASNLSAVYYEQGRYILCIDAIMNSWRALRAKHYVDGQPSTPPITEAMATKLSLRFLKAKLTGLAGGIISLHDKKKKKQRNTTESKIGIEQDIQGFCEAATQAQEGITQHAELFQIWELWVRKQVECKGHTQEECKKSRAEAEKRLRDLPIYRSPLYNAMQYFRFGHDIPKSLFFSLDGRMAVKGDTAINEVTLLRGQEQWKTLPLLYGGSGDGRHVYATMIQFVDMWKTLGQYDWTETGSDFKMPNLHLTLFDIHPAAIARVMLVFGLTRKSALIDDATDRLETEVTAFYVWSGLHMPAYCTSIVMAVSAEIIMELEGTSPRQLSKLWYVDEQTKTKVLKIFEYWSKPLPKSMERFFQANSPGTGDFSAIPKQMIQVRESQKNEDYQNIVTAVRNAYGWVNGTHNDTALPLYNNFNGEDQLFQHARILLPPKEFLSRHPALENYVRSGGRKGKVALREEVIREWKPNPTLFDNHTSENPAYSPGGYPNISVNEDPSHTTVGILEFLHAFRGANDISLDQTAFVAMQQLFDSIRKCFATLDPHEGALTLEFVCAELYSGLPKLISGDLGSRPPSFPTKYLRMWLSNTPDYTGGILSNLVYMAPYLDDSRLGVMAWNCLLNPGSFSSLKEMSLNYTYLTASGIRRFFFNCVLRDDDKDAFEEFSLSILPKTNLYSSVISKKELHDYLSYILLRALCCPRSGPMPTQVDEPTNLINFFRLVVSLNQTFFCPAHWLGDFVQSIINDNLSTAAMPFDGVLPVKQKPAAKPTERKLNLAPYQLEIENVIVTAKGAFPFFISYPERFATAYEAIKTYTATVETIVLLPYDEVSVTSPTGNLLFYKAGAGHSTSSLLKLPSRIPELIESKDGTINGIEVQIVSAVEEMDLQKKKVSWKMSEGWNDKMKTEGWSMVVWVTNLRKTVSAPLVASAWKEVPIEGIEGS